MTDNKFQQWIYDRENDNTDTYSQKFAKRKEGWDLFLSLFDKITGKVLTNENLVKIQLNNSTINSSLINQFKETIPYKQYLRYVGKFGVYYFDTDDRDETKLKWKIDYDNQN